MLIGLGLGWARVQVWVGCFSVAGEVHTCGSRWYLVLGLEKSRLEVDDVVAELVVFCLQRLIQLAQLLKLLDLVLELLDVLFLALAEGALGVSVRLDTDGTMETDLGGPVLGGTLRCAQFATTFSVAVALIVHVGRLALAHLVLLAGNGGVNGVLLLGAA